jgi:DNA-binding transcriptional ArsR family regulator
MPQTISRDVPLAELTLRRYERPSDLQGRELVRKLCLSLGLLQPGDSRDVIVDVLQALLNARKTKEHLNSDQVREKVIELRTQHNLPQLGIAQSNIRRQLKRLKDIFLVEANANNYRIAEFASLTELFKEKGESFLLNSILQRVNEYVKKVDDEFTS